MVKQSACALLAILSSLLHQNHACTTIISGKKASVDGSVMCTHSNDGEGRTDPRLVKIPAKDHAPGSMRPIYGSPENYPRYVGYDRGVPEYYPENCLAGEKNCGVFEPIGYIPEVEHTYAYFEETYGVMNEKQVGIGESTCSGVYAALAIGSGGKALFSVDQLSYVAMERASSSREAVQIMGDLAEKYGFYGADGSFEGGSESLMVTDPEEAFVFHVLADPTGTSAIWVAARVPDDSIAVVANMFSVREVNLTDSFNFLGRQDMWDLAEKEGLWKQGEKKDFTATFSDGEYAHKYYSGRRMWGVYHLLAPSQRLPSEYENLKTASPYPFSVPVDVPLTPKMLMDVHRYWYQDTEYSTALGLQGGAFGSPDRYHGGKGESVVEGNWERTIGLFRTSDSYVVQSRGWLPDAVGGVIWFGPYAAHGTVYTPIFAGSLSAPTSLSTAFQGVLDFNTSFWAFRAVENLAQIKFSYIIQNIREAQDTLEGASQSVVDQLTEAYVAEEVGMDYITQKVWENVDLARDEFISLFYKVLFTYADGFINTWNDGTFSSTSPGYPAWWLEKVGYKDGPPPVDETEMMKLIKQRITEKQVKDPEIYAEGEKAPSLLKDLEIPAVNSEKPSENIVEEKSGVASLQDCLLKCTENKKDTLEEVKGCSMDCLENI